MTTFTIQEGYLGMCAACDTADATHAEWLEFTSPTTEFPGVWHHVCDKCCNPEAKHES